MDAKAYTEVCEILKYIPDEDYNKIPKSFKQMLDQNKDKNYKFKLDESKSLKEQKLLRDTKVILAVILKKYLASPEEKQIINKKIQLDIEKIEKEKQKKYNTNNMLKKG